MTDLIAYILFAFVISMLWAPILIHMLYALNITRHAETDFSHLIEARSSKSGTPIMGGLLVVITTTVLTLIFNFNGNTVVPIAVLVISALLGGIDDLLNIFGRKRIIRPIKKQLLLSKVHKSFLMRLYYRVSIPWNVYKNIWYAFGSYPGSGIHAGEKIVVQVLAGAAVAWWIFWQLGWSTIWMPFIGSIELGVLMPFFIIFAVVSLSNAVNIADGMDGLSSGILIVCFVTFMIIALQKENPEIALLCAVTAGSLIAYLYFNIKPARFEMGDVGSLALGAMLAAIAFALDRAMLLPVVGFIFVAEVGSSVLQTVYRKIFGRRLFKMAPLHFHFQLKGWIEEKIVMRFWLFSAIFAVIAIALSQY